MGRQRSPYAWKKLEAQALRAMEKAKWERENGVSACYYVDTYGKIANSYKTQRKRKDKNK